MSFRVPTWESIGWEESDAFSINQPTRSSEPKEELPRLPHLELLQSVNWDQLSLDRPEDTDPRSSSEEVSHSASSKPLVWPKNSLDLSVFLLTTEDTTPTLILWPLMLRDLTNTRTSSSSSQDAPISQRRVKSMTQPPTSSPLPFKTPPMEFSLFQEPPEDARLKLLLLRWRNSVLTPNWDRRESTEDTTAREKRPPRRLSKLKSEHLIAVEAVTRIHHVFPQMHWLSI